MAEKETSEDNKHREAYISMTITDEVLRSRISKLLTEPKPAPWWKRMWMHPLASVIVGFICTGLIGFFLTDHYSNKQKDLEYQRSIYLKDRERERSFADELNKVRVSKIGEVWEKVDVYEAGAKGVMQKISVETQSTPAQGRIIISQSIAKDLAESLRLKTELLGLLDKYRFWSSAALFL